jgi:hypothetical protein
MSCQRRSTRQLGTKADHSSSMSCSRVRSPADKSLALRLARRFRALRALGADAVEAERCAFSELLATREPEDQLPRLYEDFLQASAPEKRRSHGVYYTPACVVESQVRLVDEVLRHRLGCAAGLADERVAIVDPAVGSGAYPMAILEHTGLSGTEALGKRMHLFEPLPGAAAVARARGLIVAEKNALASQLRIEAPFVLCLGNPPYRRGSRDPLSRQLLDGFSDGASGVHLKNLYNDYIYFWRWAIRVVFEMRSGPGVVCLVTASSYLRGPAFSGVRQTLRRTLDELYVLDLEGDRLAGRATENVFGVRTPVAIAIGLRSGDVSSPGHPAVVSYARLEGSSGQKRDALRSIQRLTDVEWRQAGEDWGDPLIASPGSRYGHWPALTELFPWQLSGAQFKRTWPIGSTAEVLSTRWQRLLVLPAAERARAFGPTRDRNLDSRPPDLLDPTRRLEPLREVAAGAPCPLPARYAYRAFDRHWVVADARLGDFPRPALWRIAGPRQIFLTTPLTAVLGPGPAAIATVLVPDLDHFRGSFGARGVIPLWRNAAATRANVSQSWLGRLSAHYGYEVCSEDLLAYCYALLSTRGYVQRFEDELRTPGPRIPLTLDGALFRRACGLGLEMLAVHTYRQVAVGEARCFEPVGDRYPAEYVYQPQRDELRLGNGRFGPLRGQIWGYGVSGYRVIDGWLRHRVRRRGKSPLDRVAPEAWTQALTAELLELIWLLEATLATEPALDDLLEEVVSTDCFKGSLSGRPTGTR